MPSTYTLNNGIELIGTGEQSGTWGDTTNTNFELLDTALDGQVSVTLAATGSSGSPNTLPISDGASSNGRNRLVIFGDGGDLGGTAFVQLTPNDSEKIIYVRNNLAGSRSILLFQGTYNASNDYEIPAGTTAVVFFNGAGSGAVAANVFNNAFFDSLRLGSVSVTAILDEDNMASNSATALSTQQSIKAYVDAQVGTVDTLAEILANGNTTGGTDLAVSTGDDITFADSSKAIFGAGSDLQIYHDGSNSFISESNATGSLFINASNLVLRNTSGEYYFYGNSDGAVNLYYDNASKLATTSTGVDITGTLVSDGLTVDGNSIFNVDTGGYLAVSGNEGQDAKLVIQSDQGDNSQDITTLIQAEGGDFTIATQNGVDRINIGATTGDISFYEDTGTTAKFFWDASAESLGIGTSSPNLHGWTTAVTLNTSSNGGYEIGQSGTKYGAFALQGDGRVQLTNFTANPLTFQTNNTERMRIDSSGNVGIGTDSPNNYSANHRSITLNAPTTPLIDLEVNGTRTGSFVATSTNVDLNAVTSVPIRFLTADTERMRIASTGELLVGTTSDTMPAAAAAGQAIMAGTRTFIATETGGDTILGGTTGSNFTAFYQGGSEAMRIDTSGNLLVGTTNSDVGGSTTGIRLSQNGSLYSSTDETDAIGNGPFYGDRRGTNNVGDILTLGLGGFIKASIGVLGTNSVSDNGGITFNTISANTTKTERMRITSAGDVGIGINSPTAPLHVQVAGSGEIARFRDNGSNAVVDVSIVNDSQTWALRVDGASSDSFHIRNSQNSTNPVTIDTSGNVGIGTSSPSQSIDTTGKVRIRDGGNTTIPSLQMGSTGVDGFALPETNTLGFITNSAEAMRIDSSGNLLVGTTSGNPTGNHEPGTLIFAGGQINVHRDNGNPLRVGNSVDGNLTEYYKQGALVGHVSTFYGNLMIGKESGAKIAFDSSVIYSTNNAGSTEDASYALGTSSSRFTDLYLSGGVYLGGTGAANKLDDYEEGTFTPTIEFGGSSTGVTYSAREGFYTKVGRLVTCFIRLQLSSNGSLSGSAQIESLPFTVGNVLTTTAYQGGSHMVNVSNAAGAQEGFTAVPNEGTTGLIIGRIADSSGNSAFTASTSQITNTFDFRLTVTYMVA